MQFGIFLPPFRGFADPQAVVHLARLAEETGWDGLFLWDHILSEPGVAVADVWVTLAAVATATEKLRIGAMVTPLPRRRPWTLARQIVTLDHLSSGRLYVGVGLGDDGWREFSSFQEELDPKQRAIMVDESLKLLRLFHSGEPVNFNGSKYQVNASEFLPKPLQAQIPIWIAGRWPNRAPLSRAARYQGYFPIFAAPDPLPAPELSEIESIVRSLSETGPGFDLVVRYSTASTPDPIDAAQRLEAAGVTWILENFSASKLVYEEVVRVVAAGPKGRS